MLCRACNQPHSPREDCRIYARRMAALGVAFESTRNQPVTIVDAVCNQCVTKDDEIAGLRNQLAELQPKPPKRNRSEYMKQYREKQKVPGIVNRAPAWRIVKT